ncbi:MULTISPECIES: 3'(2'),5'-bisphosphate nucleotidase CysQ [unclassified Novosphingobium]|uniref:3'(2'),5'-bisphosphate nucleotidase CysQ n=1 Tax=unclassified Novosphingobium TaxID=2644732 RepID=UPI00020EE68D|nr:MULTISPECIES: 3'(2'),5'-bisphosphate nucleotidase CysQ [unclassified Novosphingobium]GFM30411.1 inositol monophosphatase [Novosphingobium sp. PY1]CCA91020.1 inositol monophosphatase [Novosphingobium sp. PP1Y]
MIDRSKLESIVREAGRLALAGWPGDGHALKHWEKTPGSPVCDADLAVDAFLKKELSALLPSAGWLSEETADAPDRLQDQLVWLVDPIDGTRDFIAGRTGWAVSVALVNTRRPLFGYLYAPARRRDEGGEFWHAEAGKGSWRNGTRLAASERDSLPGARVPAKKLACEDADLTLVEQPNSIALRMAMVAADEADLLASLRWGYEWDIAAAGLIAREAGATVTDAFGKALNYNKHDPRAFGVLVTSSAIHRDAVSRLADRARRFSA